MFGMQQDDGRLPYTVQSSKRLRNLFILELPVVFTLQLALVIATDMGELM